MNTQDIHGLADLARLAMDSDELETVAKDFDAILAYIDQLKEVDVPQEVEQRALVANQMRTDEVHSEVDADELLNLAPQREGRYVKVQKIISTSDE